MKKEIFPNIVKMNKERLLDAFIWASLKGRKRLLFTSSQQGGGGNLATRVGVLGATFHNMTRSFDRLRLEYDEHFVNSLPCRRRPSVYLKSYSVKNAEKASIILRYEFSHRETVPFEELSEKIFGKQVDNRTLGNLLTCISVGTKTLGDGRKICYKKPDSFKDYVDFAKEEILNSPQYLDNSEVFAPTRFADRAQESGAFNLPADTPPKTLKFCWVKTALLYAAALEELRFEEKICYRGVVRGKLVYQKFDAPKISLDASNF